MRDISSTGGFSSARSARRLAGDSLLVQDRSVAQPGYFSRWSAPRPGSRGPVGIPPGTGRRLRASTSRVAPAGSAAMGTPRSVSTSRSHSTTSFELTTVGDASCAERTGPDPFRDAALTPPARWLLGAASSPRSTRPPGSNSRCSETPGQYARSVTGQRGTGRRAHRIGFQRTPRLFHPAPTSPPGVRRAIGEDPCSAHAPRIATAPVHPRDADEPGLAQAPPGTPRIATPLPLPCSSAG